MFTVKTVSGETCQIGLRLFMRLCLMSDQQMENAGYDPCSITQAYLKLEEKLSK